MDKCYIKRNPNISMIELYSKLRINKGYSRHACSLLRILRKIGYYKQRQEIHTKYTPEHYETPENIGIKWQLDVKYVSKTAM